MGGLVEYEDLSQYYAGLSLSNFVGASKDVRLSHHQEGEHRS